MGGRQLALCTEWCPPRLHPVRGRRRAHRTKLCVPCPSLCWPLALAPSCLWLLRVVLALGAPGAVGVPEASRERGAWETPLPQRWAPPPASQPGPCPQGLPAMPALPEPPRAAGRCRENSHGACGTPDLSWQGLLPSRPERSGRGTGAPWWQREASAGAEGCLGSAVNSVGAAGDRGPASRTSSSTPFASPAGDVRCHL